MKLAEELPKRVYVKHHSFENFHSQVGSSPTKERLRVIRLLREVDAEEEGEVHRIRELSLKDLSDGNEAATDFKITQHIADELSRLSDADVRRYIFHRYRYDVYPKKKWLDKYPPCLQIEPTSVCNFRCIFCYQIDPSFSSRSSGHMGMMTFSLFREIVDQIEGKIEFVSLASRGEPLICRDIERMLGYCSGKFLGLKLNTNSSLLTERLSHLILAGGVNTVVFSVDAAEEPLYSQLRVGGKLATVLEKIRMFASIRAKHYPKSKLITRVSGVRVHKDQEMESMVALWGELVDQVAFVKYNPWENIYETPPNGIEEPCSDLWRRMFIWYDGKVNPCDTDYKSFLSVGNARDAGISELWSSEAYHRLRELHLKRERCRLDPCQRCVVV